MMAVKTRENYHFLIKQNCKFLYMGNGNERKEDKLLLIMLLLKIENNLKQFLKIKEKRYQEKLTLVWSV